MPCSCRGLAPFVFWSSSIRALIVLRSWYDRSCWFRILIILSSCSDHAPFVYWSFSVRAMTMLRSCPDHSPFVLLPCSVRSLIILSSCFDHAPFVYWSFFVNAFVMLCFCSVSLQLSDNPYYDLAVFLQWSWCIMLSFNSDNALIMLCPLITVNALIIWRSFSLCAAVLLWSCSVLSLIKFWLFSWYGLIVLWSCSVVALIIFRPSSVLLD
jgi:hypothetical protein